ncbi:O-methylsterigmatocystin oxidoreductase [Daedaleopsis nitida]|nr:O-methylsterigmatocystin oxidoreductase [Daedaleopsis nitida]
MSRQNPFKAVQISDHDCRLLSLQYRIVTMDRDRVMFSFRYHDLVISVVLLVCFAVAHQLRWWIAWKAPSRRFPLPPGPPRLPILGNLFNAPKARPWQGFQELCTQYGDVVHLQVLGHNSVILGSCEAITEFLEKRTTNTSDRQVTRLMRLTNCDWILGFLPYGQRWRGYRRALWQHIHPGAITKYQPVQRAVAGLFLQKLLNSPEKFRDHMRFSFSATILKIGYGIDVEDEKNEIFRILNEALDVTSQAFVPGRFLVDMIPILQYVPSWIPGAEFQKLFARWRVANTRIKNLLFECRNTAFTRNGNVIHWPHTTIIDALLNRVSVEGNEITEDMEELVKDVAAVMFEAGTDTLTSTLEAMFFAMSQYPDVLKKAHDELDAVVGPNRLPDFDDFDSLVYVNAIVKEALRWHNVTPVGIPHRTLEDDVINGFFIPAGTVLIPNVWACMHDPLVYKDPHEFRPERFILDRKLNPAVLDPSRFVFGSGRRICPGRYLAEVSLFLNIACALHVFTIHPPLDCNGNPIAIEPVMEDGFLSHLEDCRCIIKARSWQAEALIKACAT